MTLESTIEKHFCKCVLERGGEVVKTTVLGLRGFPDRTAIFPGGKVWFVELKRPKGGVISPHQTYWHARLRALGAELYVFRTKEQIDEIFATEFDH